MRFSCLFCTVYSEFYLYYLSPCYSPLSLLGSSPEEESKEREKIVSQSKQQAVRLSPGQTGCVSEILDSMDIFINISFIYFKQLYFFVKYLPKNI